MEVPIISISSSEDEKQGEGTKCVSSLRSKDEEYRMLADLTGFENLKALIEGEALMKMNKRKRRRNRERKSNKEGGAMARNEVENRRDAELRKISDLTGFENLKGLMEGEALMKMHKGKRERNKEGALELSGIGRKRDMELRTIADLNGFEILKGFIEGEALMKMKKGKKQGALANSEKENRKDSEFRMLADLTGFDNLKALMEGEASMKRKQRKKKKKKNRDIEVDAPQQISVDAGMGEETVKEDELSDADSIEILENPEPKNLAEISIILVTSSDDDKQEEGAIANVSRMISDQTGIGNLTAILQVEPLTKRSKRRRKKKKKKKIDAQEQLPDPVNVQMDGEQACQEETAEIVDILKIDSSQKSTTTSDELEKLVVDAVGVNMLAETVKLAETRSEEIGGGTDSIKDVDLCTLSSKNDGLISNVISSISTGEMISVPTLGNEENKIGRRKEPSIILAENNIDDGKEEKQAEKHTDVERMTPIDDGKKGKQVEKQKDGETMTSPGAGQVENIVLQKLLRKPRYFDAPDGSWVACGKCGGDHEAANCLLQKKKKCYICGSFQHNAKHCRKVWNHFTSTERVHHSCDSNICLRCGSTGHDMFSCRSDNSPDDVKEIQCYMCKSFGHLCCVSIPDTGPGEISCYKCGHSGHLGDDCKEPGGIMRGIKAHVACYRCGERGHIARRCKVYSKAAFSSPHIFSAPKTHLAMGIPPSESNFKLNADGSFIPLTNQASAGGLIRDSLGSQAAFSLPHIFSAPKTRLVKWIPPPENYFKLNTDGSFIPQTNQASAGGLIRDSQGNWVKGFLVNIGRVTAFMAEVWGLREGLRLCLELGITRLIAEMDSMSSVQLMNGQSTPENILTTLVIDCRTLICRFASFELRHTLREGNQAADHLANMGHNAAIGTSILDSAPPDLVSILVGDAAGVYYPRL